MPPKAFSYQRVQISQIYNRQANNPTAVVDIIHGLGRLHGSTHTTPPPTTLAWLFNRATDG
jgi:hypothetical protein